MLAICEEQTDRCSKIYTVGTCNLYVKVNLYECVEVNLQVEANLYVKSVVNLFTFLYTSTYLSTNKGNLYVKVEVSLLLHTGLPLLVHNFSPTFI